jgi:hypothetical protein
LLYCAYGLAAAGTATPTSAASVGGATARASSQAAKDKLPDEVLVGNALVYVGTFTVHAKHHLQFQTGSHQYSTFLPNLTPVKLESTLAWPRLGDGLHKMEFVGDVEESSY